MIVRESGRSRPPPGLSYTSYSFCLIAGKTGIIMRTLYERNCNERRSTTEAPQQECQRPHRRRRPQDQSRGIGRYGRYPECSHCVRSRH